MTRRATSRVNNDGQPAVNPAAAQARAINVENVEEHSGVSRQEVAVAKNQSDLASAAVV
jgi:hypothetical protein